MKKILSFVMLFVVTAGLLSLRTPIAELLIGASIPSPDLKMKDVTGKEVSFNDSKKQNGLRVMFSFNTCPVVAKNQECTNEICKTALDKNVGVILLNSNEGTRDDGESLSDMQQYAKEQAYQWSYVVDKNSAMADAFGAMRTPECFLFDKNMKLVYHGAIDDNPNRESGVNRKHLSEAIKEMLDNKDVSVKTSRSIGYGIKRL